MKKFDDKFLNKLDEMEIDMPKLSEDKLNRIYEIEMNKLGLRNPEKKKFNKKVRSGLVAACLVVAFGTVVPNILNNTWENNSISIGAGAGIVEEEFKIITSMKQDEHYPVVELSNGRLNFGKYIPSMESIISFDPETTTERSLSQEDYIEYLGVDPRPSYVLTELIEQPINSLKIIENKDGTIAYDNGYFYYSSQVNKKSVKISTSKGGYPMDCARIINESTSKSNINGIEINVGYNQDMYVATFMFNGIGYEIESYNIPQKEFINMLVSILQ